LSNGQPKVRKTMVDDIIKLRRDRAKQFGVARRNAAGISSAITTGGANRGGNNNNNNNVNALQTAGGTMIGPLAFFRSPSTSVYPKSGSPPTGNNNTLDISAETGAHSSHYVWPTGGSNQMDTISGAKHAGQILVIESTETLTQTITDTSGSGGNIKTLDGNSVVLGTSKTLVLFMYSDIDTSWHQVTNPVVAAGGGGGDDLGNHTATQDLQMSTYDIIGVNNIDLDGASATVEGVVNLQFYNTSHSINSVSGIMLYQANASDVHRFAIGGVTKMELQTTKLDMSVATLDMNQGNITDVDSITFKNDTTNDYILSNTTGLLYNVNATDEHYFKVGGTTKMEVDSNEIEMFDDVRMNNNDIYEVANLRFNTSGQVFTTSSSEILYQVPSGDAHGFYVAASKVCEINDTYLEMQTNRYIDYGANITLTANAGFASLPANPIGFIKCKVNGSDARVPYYAV